MKDINVYGLGGCGITILNTLVEEGKQKRFIDQIVGVDMSGANPGIEGAFPILRLEGGEGSGGDRRANSGIAEDFMKQLLAQFPANKINIVIYGAGGGSGATMGPYLVRLLISKGIPVLSMIVGDTTSLNERKNTIGTLRSMAAQAQLLGSPILFSYRENKTGNTQGAVNRKVVQTIDNAVTMLNLENERIDYADVKNFFFFSKITDAEPILAQMSFRDNATLAEYKRTPVAALSLFSDIDSITSPFDNLLYRKAGIFGPHTEGYGESLHAILDHGSTLAELEGMIKDQETTQAGLAGKFKSTAQLTAVVGTDVNGDGMVFY